MEPVSQPTMQMKNSKPTSSGLRLVLVLVLVVLGISVIGSIGGAIRSFSMSENEFGAWFSGLFDSNNSNSVIKQEVVRTVDEESATIAVVEAASPSVVSVLERSVSFNFFQGPQTQEASIGTGFVVGENLIVSNKHVVSDTSATYSIVDKDGKRFDVSDIYRDPLNDLALLKIENGDFKALELGDSDSVKVGQTVIAIGNALGKFSNTVTKGVISGQGRGITASGGLGSYQEEIENVLQTDAALNPGNSGGPLINIGGQVIGVNVATGVGTENIGFAIPVNTAKQLISDYLSGVDRRKPFLGVRYVVITPDFAQNSDFPEGVLVREIISDGPADKAGVKVNDVITEVADSSITETSSLSSIISKYKVGDRVDLKVWRNNKTLTLSVILQAAPDSN